MRALLLAALLAWVSLAQASGTWNKLWYTPDQRGEQLLRAGKAAQAARTFRNPRSKAYAELKAGNYRQAAQDFGTFNDSNDQYNRGNALARSGKLQDALKAYDASLKRAPGNRDARHNRDLVAKALQKQQPKQKNSSSSSKNGKPNNDKQRGQGNSSNKPSGRNQPGKKDGNGKPQSSGAKPDSDKNSGQQNKPGQGNKAPATSAGQKGLQQNTKPRTAQTGQTGSNNGQAHMNAAAQTRRDAAAALEKLRQGRPQTATAAPPLTEHQLAQQQWLRQIPDDPGGLLRRKFMIEHMLRQQDNKP